MESKEVYKAIVNVMADIAIEGIAKDSKNNSQNYSFRGIDDVYNALAPIMSKNNLCILPKVLSRECCERVSAKGSPIFYVILMIEFHFVCSIDGSEHIITVCGEAMDSADKATNKAMSAAYKYACIQAFCIPTKGDNDADADTHNIKCKEKEKKHVDEIKELASEDEIDEFRLIASQANADINKILSYFKVDSVEKMTKTMVVSAIASIEKRSKQVN